MRIVFYIRPFKYLFLKNYWAIRRGEKWVYSYEQSAPCFLLDLGMITIGYVKYPKSE
jgi:hypothetical protein